MRFLVPAVVVLVAVFAIFSATPLRASAYTFAHNLQVHSSGSDVTALQELLTSAGVYSGPITGNFLTLTYKGVVAFQEKEGITPASGYFGPLTRAKANGLTSSTTVTTSESGSSIQTEIANLEAELNALTNPSSVTFTTPLVVSTTTVSVVSTTTPSTLPNSSKQNKKAPTTTATVTPTAAVSTSGIEWGAYTGDDVSDPTSFESLVGHQMNLVAVFDGWGNTDGAFPSQYQSSVAGEGQTLVIFWEPSDGSGSLTEPTYNYASITSGAWDSYFTQFASDAKAYGGPVILVPFAEMNGNWDPWDGTVNGNSASSFIAAWQHMHGFFTGDSNVKFAWDVNSDSEPDIPSNSVGSYYPGSSYVDYVGEDVFNFDNPWSSFGELANTTLSQLQTYGKPVYIFSMASASGTQKSAWITDALTTQIPNDGIAGWIWFNVNKEENWTVNSDPSSLTAFEQAVPN